MPTYEYVCRACRHEFERFQPITSSPVRTCPKCGRKRVERKIGIGAAVLFKGGGFYETDYRSESYRKTEEAEKKETEKEKELSVAAILTFMHIRANKHRYTYMHKYIPLSPPPSYACQFSVGRIQ